jgi:nucleoid-associated protein EbfC
MTENPFEALAGGLDLNALLEQAQQMQQQIASAQERLADTVVEGTVSGGAVTVGVNGVGELLSVQIRQGEFDGTDTDDLEDLGALVVAAYRDARSKADALASQTIGPLAGLGGAGGPELGGGTDGGGPAKLGF